MVSPTLRSSPPLGLALVAVSALGCGFVPKTQFNSVETQARILNEQNKAQLAEIANLKAHARKLEDQLLEAERELASLERRSDADKKRLANFQTERDVVKRQVDEIVRGAKLTGVMPVRDDVVEQLAKSYPLLRFDPLTGAYKLDAPVRFDTDAPRLKPESEKLLGEFAQLFGKPAGRDLRVLVVARSGPASAPDGMLDATRRRTTEQAWAVAEFLRKSGLRSEQIGVSGVEAAEPVATKSETGGEAASRRVDVFVTGKSTPIVGWDDGAGARH